MPLTASLRVCCNPSVLIVQHGNAYDASRQMAMYSKTSAQHRKQVVLGPSVFQVLLQWSLTRMTLFR